VIIHAGAGAITAVAEHLAPEPKAPGPQADCVSAETSSAIALAALKETVALLTFPVSHPACPERCHIEDGSAISPATIIPPHSGERLDLHMAMWICFANVRNRAGSASKEAAQ
jgi:hypothetical protein